MFAVCYGATCAPYHSVQEYSKHGVMKSALSVRNLLEYLEPFSQEFYLRNTVEVAQGLIGAYLVRETTEGIVAGRVVETEAYRENDPASHSYRGKTRRNLPMFAAGGIGYVYFIYGMYNCFNVVTEPEGTGCAVLIRAIEPVLNAEIMCSNRFPGKPFEPGLVSRIADGPGKLCRALQINREHNGLPLSAGPLRILKGRGNPSPRVSVSPRIGIKRGADLLWRFYDEDSPAVSRQTEGRPAGR